MNYNNDVTQRFKKLKKIFIKKLLMEANKSIINILINGHGLYVVDDKIKLSIPSYINLFFKVNKGCLTAGGENSDYNFYEEKKKLKI